MYDYINSPDAQEALNRLVEMVRERGILVRDSSHGEVLALTFLPHGTAHPAVMVCKHWLTLYRGSKPEPKRIRSVVDLPVWCNKAAEVGESAKQGQCERLLPQ